MLFKLTSTSGIVAFLTNIDVFYLCINLSLEKLSQISGTGLREIQKILIT